MAKKQLSFAEKSVKHKSHKDWKTVKYVKSERSSTTGNWRFNESFIQLSANENLDQALARIENEVKALAEEMTSFEDITPKVAGKSVEKIEEILETTETEIETKKDPEVKTENTELEQPTKKA